MRDSKVLWKSRAMKNPSSPTIPGLAEMLACVLLCLHPAPALAERTVIPLDGRWDLAEGGMADMPRQFERRVTVPGLVDEARPAFAEVGLASPRRQAFWYRRSFRIKGEVPAVATLKVHKAAYGARVFLNGVLLGEHLPSFTPGYFDARGALRGKGAANELVIRVGATREALPPTIASGWDFEKSRYIPGLFDSVELILSGTPHIVRMQAAPEIASQTVRVQAVVRNAGLGINTRLHFKVREARSGKLVGQGNSEPITLEANAEQTVDARLPIRGCRLWSPEDPFLYELEATTGADTLRTRFGMREFRLDHATGRAMLNGRPYFLRGSNVTLYRFFEDPQCADRPWREDWVRRLHRAFKGMHWNALRYCIGFPPEVWYRIADEEGILIQDEFPIWHGHKWPAELKSDELIQEYTEWMQERWNHPCVVLWDAQNESVTVETGKAIQAVRGLDLSNRPWDNGYGEAQSPGDSYESHPYLFNNAKFTLPGLARISGVPRGNARANTGNNPIIINEYDWLWLNRDGSPTTLSRKVYENLLGTNATPAQRWHLNARYHAALTEFWRAHRACAGVLHFCSLGYSRTNGQTCDNFTELEKLRFAPEFKEHMGQAFSPVGLMIDEWRAHLPAGKELDIPVIAINDLYEEWKGKVRFRILGGGKRIMEQARPCEVAALGQAKLSFACKIPSEPGDYQLEAALLTPGARAVCSLRDFRVRSSERRPEDGIARGKPVRASSTYMEPDSDYRPENAVDGLPETRWSSEFSDPQWLAIDLGAPMSISRVILDWETACARSYAIQVSLDGTTWQDVYTTTGGKGDTEEIKFSPATARWVRLYGTKRATPFGYSLWEMRVFP
jgi:beta-galactosidase